nr:alpha/beta fold hydrolase [Streptomyces cyanogenus]
MHEPRIDGGSRYRPSATRTNSPTPFLRDLKSGPVADGSVPEEAECTLVFAHHAGGSAVSFMSLRDLFPDHWRLLALELPGRGAASAAPVAATMAEAVSSLLPAVTGHLTGPYALFGHSMGGLVAYELTRELARLGLPPVLLGVSASPAPHMRQVRDRYRDLRTEEQLAGFLHDLGGTPPEVFDEPDLLEYLTRILRADLSLLQNYTADPSGVLDVPLAVYYGESDPMAGRDLVSPWADYSSAGTGFRSWPGGHFYLFDRPEDFAGRWERDVRAAAERAARHRPTLQGAPWA